MLLQKISLGLVVLMSLLWSRNINAKFCTEDEVNLKRTKRQLLFPNSTLLQLNAGVGTPTPIKTIAVNWAFQANFQLPWNRTQIPTDIFGANTGYEGDSRSIRELERTVNVTDIEKSQNSLEKDNYGDEIKLHHIYKYMEDLLTGFGYNGTTCVLLTLCQLGAEPLYSDNNEDLLHEIANFILNPANDILNEETTYQEAKQYRDAFKTGSSNQVCLNQYAGCDVSLIDMFSKVYDNS